MTRFRRASREGLFLKLVLIAGSGDGKTNSALRLATGIADGGRILMIDTDNGRSGLYSDDYVFDVDNLLPPHSAERYTESIEAAKSENPAVLIVDTVAEEHEQMLVDQPKALQGIVDRMEKAAKRSGRRFDRWECTQKMSMNAWAAVKAPRTIMRMALRTCQFHVIICARASKKLNVDTKKKEMALECHEGFIKDATASLWLPPNSDGVPDLSPKDGMEPHTKIDKCLRPVLTPGRQLSEEVGRELVAALYRRKPAGPSAPKDLPHVAEARKSEDASAKVAIQIEQCATVAELVDLYNKVMVFLETDEREQLLPAFKQKKQELTSGDTATPQMRQPGEDED